MKLTMRSTPAVSQRGVTSTNTRAENGAANDCAIRPVSPPIEAPTSTGLAGRVLATQSTSSTNCSGR